MKRKVLLMAAIIMMMLLFAGCGHTHNYGEWTLVSEPSLTEAGSAERECSACSEKEEVVVPVLGDTSVWAVAVVDATCTEKGSKTYTSVYGEVTLETEALGHKYGDWTLVGEPTENEVGSAEKVCSVCGNKEEVEVSKLSDTSVWTVMVVDATCSEKGSKTYTSVYGEVTLETEALGHDYGDWTLVNEPTETKGGSAERECSVCGEKEVVEVPELSDTSVWAVAVVDATCTEKGSKTYTSVYGVVTLETEALGHNYGSWTLVSAPTETKGGSAERECSVCGNKEEVEVPELTDSSVWTLSVVDPSCGDEGSKTYTSVYGKVTLEIEALGHDYGDWTLVSEPTETAPGSAERECSVCGNKEEIEVPELSDTSVWGVAVVDATCSETGSKTYTSVYGEVTLEIEALGHDYGDWTLVSEPTETKGGSAERECSVCGEKEVVEVPELSDTSVWTLDEVNATYNEGGTLVYSSVYGTLEFATPKLVAPYDNKTYASFALDATYQTILYRNNKINPLLSWNSASVTLDENGVGLGTSFPFNGLIEITMVDPETGRINIKRTPYSIDEETGELIFRYDNVETAIGYVDMETGLIVRTHFSIFNYLHVLTPYEVGVTLEQVSASSWDNAVAIQYTYEDNTYNIFVYNERVYFNVEFIDGAGLTVLGADCYQSEYLYVYDNSGKQIASYAYDGEKLVSADGYEGLYTLGDDQLLISGYGVLSYNGVQGRYELFANGSEYTIGIYVEGIFNEVLLDTEDMTYSMNKPMVNITFNAGEYGEGFLLSTNKNIEILLPELTDEYQTFKGWHYDEALLEPVGDRYLPTEDITLYALWVPKVIIYLDDIVEGDSTTLLLGEGDIIGEFLPKYTIDLNTERVFKGWYMDPDFELSLPEEAVVEADNSGIIIYAKWEALPAYYGSYKGVELWGKASGNSRAYELTIDENNNMSGIKKGIIISYDPLTQLVSWKDNESATKVKYFWYNDELGVIAGIYKDAEIGTDFYILSKYQTEDKIADHYAVNAPVEPGSTVTGYYARFISIMTREGLKTIFLYNNYIYSNIIIEDTAGTPLIISEIKDSKTVVVRNSLTNERIIGVASLADSFDDSSKTTELDNYYGVYTSGEEAIVLDGTGLITMGEKSGRYQKVEGATYDFDVFLEDDTEYYQLTLDSLEYTILKPLVLVHFEVGEDHTPIASIEYNINVAATIPSGLDEGWVFNGWFLDQEFSRVLPTPFIPTEETTIYAKYSVPAIITIVYNNGEDNEEVIYSVGDITDIPRPLYTKHAFEGWFTTEVFEEGSLWTSGEAILESVIIYAKWSVAPPYNNLYVPTELENEIENNNFKETDVSAVWTWSNVKSYIDPYGWAPSGGYPINGGDVLITDYNEDTGELVFNVGEKVRKGWIDPATGILIVNVELGLDVEYNEVLFFNPFELESLRDSISSSYWDFGRTRTIQYTFEGTVYSIFIYNDKVYFDVAFKDSEDNDISGVDCYQATTLYVYDADGALIAKFGYDGTMKPLDGYEGLYSNGEDTLELNGVKNVKLNGVTGEYYQISDLVDTFDVYVDGVCYEVVVDKDNYTYTIHMPMVTLGFDNDEKGEIESVTINRNIAHTLPIPEYEGYVFRGWYKEATFDTLVDNNYIPTITETLYAKWDILAILTIIYDNGMEDEVRKYGAGDLVELIEPGFTNGFIFGGWYLDLDYTIPYYPGEITETINVYCKWNDPIAHYGDYKGINIYGSTPKGNKTSGGTSTLTLSVTPYGDVTGQRTGQIEDYDEETGTFKFRTSANTYYWGVLDKETGLLTYSYSSNKETLGNDLYVFIAGAETVTGSNGSYWNSGLTKLVSLEITGHERTSMNLFIYNDVLYTDVTWTSTDGEVTAIDAWNSNQLSLFDSDGTLIVEFVKDADQGLVEVL